MARLINFIMASLALLSLACRAAGSTDASEARRLSKEDHRTFRGTLDPPAAGRGRHHVFIHIPKAAGGSWMRASPNWMSRKDTLTGSHEKNAFSPVTLGQLKKGPPGAVPGRRRRPPRGSAKTRPQGFDTIPPRPPPPGRDVVKVRARDRYEGPVPCESRQDVGRGVERRVRRSQRRGRGL